MSQIERELFKRLGPQGLRSVLGDVLDAPRLVKLANACGLRYPGMRTQSQKRDRILSDLVERAEREDAARRAIYRTLSKETAAAVRQWSSLPADERTRRLNDGPFLEGQGVLGLHLFLLIAGSGTDEEIAGLLSRTGTATSVKAAPGEEAPADDLSREAARLRKKNQELQKKLQYLDGQIGKAREAEKAVKRELMQRKGELAESRMLVERLRKESQGAQIPAPDATPVAQPRAAAASAPAGQDPTLEQLASASKKLAQEQKKISHALEKLRTAPPPAVFIPAETLAPVLEAIEELKKETSTIRRERKKEEHQQERVLEDLRSELRAFREESEESPTAPSRSGRRRKGDAERLGIFIDVQNVYYAARQLKGKLDFDALLQTVVRGRRLIQAKAYVVESQEIDQSGFIAMLQQRAIEVRRKTLKIRSDGSMKGDWDMEMALDILDAAPKLDVVVLVSGDGDFTSLVNRVKAMGPRVEVAAFPRNTAKSLLEAADEFQPLDRKFMIRLTETGGGRSSGDAPSRSTHAGLSTVRAAHAGGEVKDAGEAEGIAPAGAQK